MTTIDELKQLRAELKRNETEIELTRKILEQRKKLADVKKKKNDSAEIEVENLEKDFEIQNKLEDIQIKRVQKRNLNIARMNKALGINQVKALPAPKENEIIIPPAQEIDKDVEELTPETLTEMIDEVDEELSIDENEKIIYDDRVEFETPQEISSADIILRENCNGVEIKKKV